MRNQWEVVIPLESLKLVSGDNEYVFDVVKTYMENSRDLLHLVLEPATQKSKAMQSQVPPGAQRPIIGRYTPEGLKLIVVDHTEVS